MSISYGAGCIYIKQRIYIHLSIRNPVWTRVHRNYRRLNIEERVMQRTEMELAKLVHLCAFRGDKGFYYRTCRVGEEYTT